VTDRDTALSELARRFLAGHGPGDDRDLAKWAGITLGDARRGLRSVSAELEELPGGLVDLAGRDDPQGRRIAAHARVAQRERRGSGASHAGRSGRGPHRGVWRQLEIYRRFGFSEVFN